MTIGQKVAPPTRREEREAYELVQLRDRGTCVRCGGHGIDGFGTNFDHRKNRSQGGLTTAANGQTLCGSGTTGCHGHMTTHPADATANGYAVPSWADPAEWPARRLISGNHQWVLYNNSGRYTVITEQEAQERMA
jgi:hypothetical protein